MGRLFLFFFILLQSTFIHAESYTLKCDANNSLGVLSFVNHENRQMTLAVGGERKSFAPENYKRGIYKAKFQRDNADKKLLSKIRKTEVTIYLIVHQQLPAGFMLIRGGHKRPVVIDFQEQPIGLDLDYTNFDKQGDDAPPDNKVKHEYLFVSQDFLLGIHNRNGARQFCLGRFAIRNKDKEGLSVTVGGLKHSIPMPDHGALDRSFVRPPSTEPDAVDNNDNDNDDNDLPAYQDDEVSLDNDSDEGDDNASDLVEGADDDVVSDVAERRVVLYVPSVQPQPVQVLAAGSPSRSLFSSFMASVGGFLQAADDMVGEWFTGEPDVYANHQYQAEEHTIFGLPGWRVAENAPFSVTYRQDIMRLSFSANKEQGVVFNLPSGSNKITFTACLNGQDENSTTQFFVKEVESGAVVTSLSENEEKQNHLMRMEDNYSRFTMWFSQEEGKNYKLYFTSNPDTDEAVELSIREFAVE